MGHRTILPLAAAPLLVALSACVAEPPPAGVMYVRRAPPPARVEAIERSPGPEYVWIGGHHAWIAGTYVWSPGNWERRPRAHARWVGGRWKHDRHGWYWIEGHWTETPATPSVGRMPTPGRVPLTAPASAPRPPSCRTARE